MRNKFLSLIGIVLLSLLLFVEFSSIESRSYNNGLIFYNLKTMVPYLPPTVSVSRGRNLANVKFSAKGSIWSTFGKPCDCHGPVCGCCAGIRVKQFNFDQKMCANVTHRVRQEEALLEVYLNEKTSAKYGISTRNPAPFCIPVMMGIPMAMCVQMSDIAIKGNNLHMCMDFVVRLTTADLFEMHFQCMDIGLDGFQYVDKDGNPVLPPGENSKLPATTDSDEDYYDEGTVTDVNDNDNGNRNDNEGNGGGDGEVDDVEKPNEKKTESETETEIETETGTEADVEAENEIKTDEDEGFAMKEDDEKEFNNPMEGIESVKLPPPYYQQTEEIATATIGLSQVAEPTLTQLPTDDEFPTTTTLPVTESERVEPIITTSVTPIDNNEVTHQNDSTDEVNGEPTINSVYEEVGQAPEITMSSETEGTLVHIADDSANSLLTDVDRTDNSNGDNHNHNHNHNHNDNGNDDATVAAADGHTTGNVIGNGNGDDEEDYDDVAATTHATVHPIDGDANNSDIVNSPSLTTDVQSSHNNDIEDGFEVETGYQPNAANSMFNVDNAPQSATTVSHEPLTVPIAAETASSPSPQTAAIDSDPLSMGYMTAIDAMLSKGSMGGSMAGSIGNVVGTPASHRRKMYFKRFYV